MTMRYLEYLERYPQFISPGQACEIANIDLRCMHGLCERGEVRAFKIGRQWRIDRDAFLAKLGIVEAVQ